MNYFSGQANNEGSYAVYGAEASLAHNGTGYFTLCVGSSDMYASSSVWAAMEIPGSFNDIYQAGKIRCGHGFALPLCDGTVHDFYASGYTAGHGSCTVTKAPTAVDEGPSPAGSAFYQVWRDSNGTGNYYTGNVSGGSNPGALCWWTSSGVYAGYTCETGDRGDQCGGLSATPEVFNHIRYRQTVGGTWQNAGGSQANCNSYTTYSAYHCDYVDNQTFNSWSDSR